MNRSETAQALAHMAAYDRRTLGEADVLAWHTQLADYQLADVIAAVVDHYGASRDFAMPADIRNRVHAKRRARLTAAGTAADPDRHHDESDADYRQRLLTRRRQIADGDHAPEAQQPARALPTLPTGMRSLGTSIRETGRWLAT